MADFSPRKAYRDIAERLGVQPDDFLPVDRQLEHIIQQITEMRIIINRNIVDIAGLEKSRQEAHDTATITAYDSQIAKYSSDVRQLVDKLELLNRLKSELEA